MCLIVVIHLVIKHILDFDKSQDELQLTEIFILINHSHRTGDRTVTLTDEFESLNTHTPDDFEKFKVSLVRAQIVQM